MAKPRSQDKRSAILDAATRVIFNQGLSAPTALIAQQAGVANGSLFTYFQTKAELFNQLYLELKTAMATAALEGLPADADLRDQLYHIWCNWTAWAVAHPEKRRALAQLAMSEELTPSTREAAFKAMAGLARLMERARANGPMRNAPKGFASAITNSLAETTMDFMVNDPDNAKKHCKAGFEAAWRVLS